MSQAVNNNEEQKNLIEEIKIEEVPSNGLISAPKDEAKPQLGGIQVEKAQGLAEIQ